MQAEAPPSWEIDGLGQTVTTQGPSGCVEGQQGGPPPLDIVGTGWEVQLCRKTLALESTGLGSSPALAISLLCDFGVLLTFSEPASLAEHGGE